MDANETRPPSGVSEARTPTNAEIQAAIGFARSAIADWWDEAGRRGDDDVRAKCDTHRVTLRWLASALPGLREDAERLNVVERNALSLDCGCIDDDVTYTVSDCGPPDGIEAYSAGTVRAAIDKYRAARSSEDRKTGGRA